MSTVKTFVVLVGVWFGFGLGFANLARAGTPIEFEFGGVFTQTTGTVFQPGQSFTTTVKFDPDAPDMDPSPLLGRYTYLSWTAPYRTATPIVLVPPSGAIEILAGAGGGSHGWQISYFGASAFRFELDVDYPNGTFGNDRLPLSLDLTRSSATRFEVFDGNAGVDLRGTITSFRVVPEPSLAWWMLFLAALRPRQRNGRL